MNSAVPISREAVQKSVQDISSSIQENLVQRLIEDTNQGISEAILRNLNSYCIHVPIVVFGFPAYNANNVANELNRLYSSKGFDTYKKDNIVILSW